MASETTAPRSDDAAVEAEIVQLHDFFTTWFRGEVPDTGETFAPLPSALADGFVLVPPAGTTMDRTAVLQDVRGAHGSWSDTDRIEIRNAEIRQRSSDTIIATYEEWQSRGGKETTRVSTVVFTTELRWLHVHETRLPAP